MAFLGGSAQAVLMFGGVCDNGALCSDDLKKDGGLTWELTSDNTWAGVSPSEVGGMDEVLTPKPRKESAMATLWTAPVRGTAPSPYTVVMLGGLDGTNSVIRETWTYAQRNDADTSTWKLHTPAATPIDRAMFSMAQVPGRNTAVLFGGSVAVADQHATVGLRDNVLANDTWTYTFGKENSSPWKKVAYMAKAVRPPPRNWHQLAGLSNGTVLLFGGSGCSATESGVCQKTKLLKETWLFDLVSGTWSKPKVTSKFVPSARQYHAMSHLTGNHVVMFGGVVVDEKDTVCFFYFPWLLVLLILHGTFNVFCFLVQLTLSPFALCNCIFFLSLSPSDEL